VDGCLNARFCPAGIDDDVRTGAELALGDHVLCVLLCADSSALEAGSRGEFERELQSFVVDVYGNYLGRAVGFCYRAAQETNGPRSKNYNRVAGLHTRLPCDVHRNGSRLDERTLLQAHALGQFVTVVLRQSIVPREGAIEGRGSCELHIRAKIVLAILAADAAAAGHAGLHCDAIADLECSHLVADRVHDTCRLVAQNHGLLDNKVTDAPFDPVVHV
jgi:hypothetical protein